MEQARTITHELKTHTQYFNEIYNMNKTFEVRKNDRDFKVGDILVLRDYDNEKSHYRTGIIIAKVTYVMPGGKFGVEEGYCCMSFDIVKKEFSIDDDLPF